ncbi:hypothetical protein pipiens_013723 [Culex pipiens pipiens]|uniref:SecA family profile domain-containing protein n=1 Tax=Culex pipiens pipiens TaxID=38569 RepID=A0ABD1CZU1_CULPP
MASTASLEKDPCGEQNQHDEILEAIGALFELTQQPSDDDFLEAIVRLYEKPPAEIEILEAIAGLYLREGGEAEFAVAESDETLKPDVRPPSERTHRTADITFRSPNGLEFIALVSALPVKVSQLGCSARILQSALEIRLHNEGCLLLVDDSFVARVELMHVGPVLQANSFNQAVTALFRQLRIDQILVDQVMARRDQLRAGLLASIDHIRERSPQDPAEALNLLAIVQKSANLKYIDFCELLMRSTAVSERLREQASALHQVEVTTERRNRFLARFHGRFANASEDLEATLKHFSQVVVENRTESLLAMAPPYLGQHLKDVPQRLVLQIHDSDVKTFHDLDNVLNKEIFAKPLADLAERWIRRVRSFKVGQAIAAGSVNPVYFSLCRSLEELILEIASRTDHNPGELLQSDRNGWHSLNSMIQWKSETPLTKCLQREYYFVVRLLKHFDPATDNAKPFAYRPSRLLPEGTSAKASTLDSIMRPIRWVIGRVEQNPLGIADEFYVWFCLLDDVLQHVLPETDHNLEMFEQILKSFVQLVSKATVEQMETIRVITHNTGRFIVQTCPFVNSDRARSGEDKPILQSQLDAINRIMVGSESANFFRDLIDVFSEYWKNRCEIIENIPAKNALARMEQIKKQLLTIVLDALRKSNVSVGHIVDLFRSLNDFLIDLDDVSFDWLIKSLPEKQMKAVQGLELIEPLADHKWTGTDNQTYRVLEPIKFQQLFVLLLDGAPCPKHYVIDIISNLLELVLFQLEHKLLPEPDQIVSCSVLLSSIRSSLMYLREQADYVSFDLFLDESIKPFSNVVRNSQSLNEFLKRIALIKESFCYIRKQNEMSIAEALRMYDELNGEGDHCAEKLQQAYQQYSDQFVQYMAEPAREEEDLDKADVVAKLVRESVPSTPNLFSGWTTQFKLTELPKILAGVAAVWSITVSVDVSSTGKYFKPHCIQILCVLRLLSADRAEDGVGKHLAQVLTGQGKSLVLAMIAAVLALTGHQVQLVCYNQYLVNRDKADFDDLYDMLEIGNAIRYGTFNNMANAVIAPEIDGTPKNLRSILDVFFTKDYYGSNYQPIVTPTIAGLDAIQEKIWNLVNTQGMRDVPQLTTRVHEFIASPSFKSKRYFDHFLHRRSSYELLVYSGDKYTRKQFTNGTLFSEQLKLMITCAISVADNKRDWVNFKLNEMGVIMYRSRDRFVTSTVSSYHSMFNYFRLKKRNFMPMVSNLKNYGYLIIACGPISYAMLPKTFPLILGVTGTLTSLNQHEKAAIERLYNIRRSSLMPSFFGCCNVQFNPAENLTVLSSKQFWMGQIFSRAHAAIGAKRAVIIFFYNDALLENFRAQYCGQLDRLEVLTENTAEDEQEVLIGEAGVAKTVTLATRGMGRGVDYKSSVAVEKSGGVHVIQTFFSLDVKEETQIRGRTARKDNKGSYELILCEAHLKTQRLMANADLFVTYAKLDAARAEIALKEDKDVGERIAKNTGNHMTTLAYLQSFFA